MTFHGANPNCSCTFPFPPLSSYRAFVVLALPMAFFTSTVCGYPVKTVVFDCESQISTLSPSFGMFNYRYVKSCTPIPVVSTMSLFLLSCWPRLRTCWCCLQLAEIGANTAPLQFLMPKHYVTFGWYMSFFSHRPQCALVSLSRR